MANNLLENDSNDIFNNNSTGVDVNFGSLLNASIQNGKYLYFPDELVGSNQKYPYIMFRVNGGTEVFLPLPQGLNFSDNAEYSTVDLGIIGTAAQKISSEENRQKTKENLLGELASAGITNLSQNAGGESVGKAISISRKKIVSPNTQVTFQNTQIRNFNFEFKMIAKSRGESDRISEIVKTFRNNLYPKTTPNGLVMHYPPTWVIKFFDPSIGGENPYIPKIKTSYMTSFSSTYNSGTNMLHYDGAPIEVDISIAFQEMKSLSRQDIEIENETYYN